MPLSNGSSTPSLTSSVDSAQSFSLPSPKESNITELPKLNGSLKQPGMSSSDTFDHSPHFATSPPPSPSPPLSPPHNDRNGTPSPPDNLANNRNNTVPKSPRYRPYPSRILPGLRYTARSLGRTFPSDVTLQEVDDKRAAFVEVLSAMPDTVLLLALDAKQADHDCLSLRLALANAEVKSWERRMAFFSTMREQHSGAHAVSAAYLDMLYQVTGSRGLRDAEYRKEHFVDQRAQICVASTASQMQLAQLEDVVGSRLSRFLGRGRARSDPYRRYNEDPFDRYSDASDEGSDDGSLLGEGESQPQSVEYAVSA